MATGLDFLLTVGKLKRTLRTGWVQRAVKTPESVADHQWRMAVMAMVLPGDSELDTSRMSRMAIVHGTT